MSWTPSLTCSLALTMHRTTELTPSHICSNFICSISGCAKTLSQRLQVVSMLTNTIDRLFQRNPRYDGHGLLGVPSLVLRASCLCVRGRKFLVIHPCRWRECGALGACYRELRHFVKMGLSIDMTC